MAITPLTKKREYYSDFRKDMLANPVTTDLARIVNEEAVKESIKNLVLTNRGERLFQPNVGCDVTKQLFENVTPDTIRTIKKLIRNTLESYEPRAEILSVDVGGRLDANELKVSITFVLVNTEKPTTVDVLLKRIR